MDKKKLFQKQLLQSQIVENTNNISKLQVIYDNLKLQTNDITSNSNGTISLNLLLEQIKNLENI